MKKLLISFLVVASFSQAAFINVPTKNTGSTLTSAEFNQILGAIELGTYDINSGTVSASALQVNGAIRSTTVGSVFGGSSIGYGRLNVQSFSTNNVGNLNAMDLDIGDMSSGALNALGQIGFGYVFGSYRPAVMAYKITNAGGSTSGEFGWYLRGTADNVPPVKKMTLSNAGDLEVSGTVSANEFGTSPVNFATTAINGVPSSTLTGWAGTPTTNMIMVSRQGKRVFVAFYIAGNSNANIAYFSVPWASRNDTLVSYMGAGQIVDNGAIQTTPGWIVLTPGTSTVTVYVNWAASAVYTTSGVKKISGSFYYDVP